MRIATLFLGCVALASCSRVITSGALPATPTNLGSALPPSGAGYKVIFRFSPRKGLYPEAALTYVKGTLYGTTHGGGTSADGTVFKITTAGVEEVLHSFKGSSDGADPAFGVLTVLGGTLYGTTQYGGSSNDGTVFKITTSGVEKTLYSFKGGKDGANPIAALANIAGTLYGTTQYGGSSNNGTVFKITPSGTERVLYSFKGGIDGAYPTAGLIDVKGALYGTTEAGGSACSYGCGTVFKITTGGAEKVLYAFKGASANDGAQPTAGLTEINETLYGTTSFGNGASGTVFKVTTSGAEKVIHTFSYGSGDGEDPLFGSLIDVNSTLYGTTRDGGSNAGVVFKITTSGAEKVLYRFKSGNDGGNPYAGLVDVKGRLFGTTSAGGEQRVDGTAYTILP